MNALYLPARAKLNLVLRVVGRRADGYHLLETLYHALDLHDDVWLEPADGMHLAVTADEPGCAVGAGPDNLVCRALAAIVAASPARGFRAHLHKRIPHGGGLGGGSSDAAAALRLANALLPAPLPMARLHEIGSRLGADVPFFLAGGSQWGRGIGDELTLAVVPAMHFVLVVPPFPCPTAEVYKNHAAARIPGARWNGGAPQDTVAAVTVPTTRDSAVRFGFTNDLEPAAERVRPALAALRQRVADLGHCHVAMTGSGSTLFVACADAAAARRCEQDLAVLRAEGVRLIPTRSGEDGGGDVPQLRPWPKPGSLGG